MANVAGRWTVLSMLTNNTRTHHLRHMIFKRSPALALHPKRRYPGDRSATPAQYRCGNCGAFDHNKRSCPLRNSRQQQQQYIDRTRMSWNRSRQTCRNRMPNDVEPVVRSWKTQWTCWQWAARSMMTLPALALKDSFVADRHFFFTDRHKILKNSLKDTTCLSVKLIFKSKICFCRQR